jgi:hypothetical protein
MARPFVDSIPTVSPAPTPKPTTPPATLPTTQAPVAITDSTTNSTPTPATATPTTTALPPIYERLCVETHIRAQCYKTFYTCAVIYELKKA